MNKQEILEKLELSQRLLKEAILLKDKYRIERFGEAIYHLEKELKKIEEEDDC